MQEAAACPVDRGFDPLSAAYLQDPYPLLNAAREAAPVFFAPSIGYWVVTRYDDVKAVLADPRTFSARVAQEPLLPLTDEARAVLQAGLRTTPVLSNFDPPGHTRIRQRLGAALSVRRMNLLRPWIERRADDLIASFAGDGRADLVRQLTFPLPALTIFTLLGFPDEDAETLKSWCGDKLEINWGRPSPDYQSRAVASMTRFWDYCEQFVERRKREPRDDLTSELLEQRASDPEALDDRELASVLFALSFAGHETTTNLLSNALRQLLARPGLWEEVCATPALIDGAVEETLRFDTSVIAWRRVATRATAIGGVSVPAGAKLMLAFGAANHDPRHFPDPEEYDIRRDNAHTQLSFGWGIHFCLGASLARIESGIVLRLLAERLPGLRLAADQQLTFPPNISFRGPYHLLAEWDVA